MAQLKDLIVNGPSRFIGGLQGDLTGNADTATTATKVEHTLTIGSYTFNGSANVTIPIYNGATS